MRRAAWVAAETPAQGAAQSAVGVAVGARRGVTRYRVTPRRAQAAARISAACCAGVYAPVRGCLAVSRWRGRRAVPATKGGHASKSAAPSETLRTSVARSTRDGASARRGNDRNEQEDTQGTSKGVAVRCKRTKRPAPFGATLERYYT